MKIIHKINDINLDTSRKIYTCTKCGKLFNWGENCYWFGSYRMLENKPEKIKYACSDECKNKL